MESRRAFFLLKARTFLLVGLFFVVFCGCPVLADTWHLKQGQTWQNISEDAEGKQMLAIAMVKQHIAAGEVSLARKALEKLKNDFPDVAGPDLDVFLRAELFYAKANYVKAVKNYDEFLDKYPDSWLYESAMEREYSVAVAYLGGQKRRVLRILKLSAYEEGSKIMRRIADRMGDAPIAQRALITLADAQEKRGEFLDAYETWADISTRWPTGDIGRLSLLSMAQSLHSAYKGPKYDAASLVSARTYYRNFKLRYPEYAGQHEIDKKLEIIEEQIAYKQFMTGRYYENIGDVAAAGLYYGYVVDNWPGSAAAKLAQERLQPQPAGDPAQKTITRTLFDAGNVVLDEWLSFLSF